MSFLKNITLFSTLSVLSLSLQANEIGLDQSVVMFEKNMQKKVLINITNHSKNSPAYVKAVVKEVIDPQRGTKSKLVEFQNPKDAGLFVTPNKQIIHDYKDKGSLSIINVNQSLDKERVYRVDVTPVISGKEKGDVKGQRIKVILGYDVLVYVQPNNPVMSFDHTYHENKLFIENTGNAHFELIDGEECKEDMCTPLSLKGKLFADKRTSLKVSNEITHVNYRLLMRGMASKRVTFEK
jgi:hypothetical protein